MHTVYTKFLTRETFLFFIVHPPGYKSIFESFMKHLLWQLRKNVCYVFRLDSTFFVHVLSSIPFHHWQCTNLSTDQTPHCAKSHVNSCDGSEYKTYERSCEEFDELDREASSMETEELACKGSLVLLSARLSSLSI